MKRIQRDAEDSKRFEAMLLAKRNEILKNVSELQYEALRPDTDNGPRVPNHPADVGTDNFDLDNTVSLMESERQILMGIDRALEFVERLRFQWRELLVCTSVKGTGCAEQSGRCSDVAGVDGGSGEPSKDRGDARIVTLGAEPRECLE